VNDTDAVSPFWAASPALSEARVDAWLISLAEPSAADDSRVAVLSQDERERAARFKFDGHRRLYVAAHAAVRRILSRYLKVRPEELRFVNGSSGKPSLTGKFAASGLRFNLSHSHEMALLGVTRGREIGVDIEWIKEDYGYQEVAKRFFTPNEVAQLRSLPASLQRQAFFKCWTSKEAFLKAKGTGLSGKLDEVEIALADDRTVRVRASVSGWTLSELTADRGYEAAVVTEAGPLPVHCYRWQEPAADFPPARPAS
jgi:4'-phosphopantetheinyl transferase